MQWVVFERINVQYNVILWYSYSKVHYVHKVTWNGCQFLCENINISESWETSRKVSARTRGTAKQIYYYYYLYVHIKIRLRNIHYNVSLLAFLKNMGCALYDELIQTFVACSIYVGCWKHSTIRSCSRYFSLNHTWTSIQHHSIEMESRCFNHCENLNMLPVQLILFVNMSMCI